MPRLSTDSPEFRQASSLQSSPSLCSQIRTTRDNPGGHGTVTEQSNPCQLLSPDDAFCAPTQGPGPASQTPHVTHCVGLAVLHPPIAAAWSHPNQACLIKYWCKCHNTEMLCHLMPPSTVAVCIVLGGKEQEKKTQQDSRCEHAMDLQGIHDVSCSVPSSSQLLISFLTASKRWAGMLRAWCFNPTIPSKI